MLVAKQSSVRVMARVKGSTHEHDRPIKIILGAFAWFRSPDREMRVPYNLLLRHVVIVGQGGQSWVGWVAAIAGVT